MKVQFSYWKDSFLPLHKMSIKNLRKALGILTYLISVTSNVADHRVK